MFSLSMSHVNGFLHYHKITPFYVFTVSFLFLVKYFFSFKQKILRNDFENTCFGVFTSISFPSAISGCK